MTKASDTKAAKGGGNRWLNYVKSHREKNATKPGKKQQQSEILKEAGRLWKEMSDDEKNKFATPSEGPVKK